MENFKEELACIGLELGKVVSVPYFENSVQAGLPTEVFDGAKGNRLIPEELADKRTYTVNVRGESMIDFDIHEGDQLICREQCTADGGDTVIAMINGSCTVKVFFEDEDGDKWLIPGNPEFSPILLNPDDDNYIIAVVKEIIHKTPRVSYRDCVKAIKQCKKERKKRYTDEDIARALKSAQETMEKRGQNSSRLWYAVYRTFVDREIVGDGDYAGFVSILEKVMGDEAPNINIKDMRANLEVMSFSRPVALWSIDNAPVGSKRYYDYLEVAKATSRGLSNN